MHSMTGFGQALAETATCRVAVTVRSVNHRYLDVVIRLPEDHRDQEAFVREQISRKLFRGRIETRIDIDDRRPQQLAIEIDREAISALTESLKPLVASGTVADGLRLRDLLLIPGAVRISTGTGGKNSELEGLLQETLGRALAELSTARMTEGEKLNVFLQELLKTLLEQVAAIASHTENLVNELTERFRKRVGELLGESPPVDEDRLAQEVALLVERSDIREELDRLATHSEHFRAIMLEDGAIGKRLDYLVQEMLRELNTLSAKCRHTEVLKIAIDARLSCEQIREQLQNVE